MKNEPWAIEISRDEPFQYTALADETSKRLLSLRPQKRDGLIQVDTWETKTTDNTPYRCLSYTWGAPEITNTVLLNGRPMGVRRNLHEFLDMVVQRLSIDPSWLGAGAIWIDALCINQNDDVEKSTHVQHMGSIYEHAEEVLIWLGNSSAIGGLFEWLNKSQRIRDKIALFVPQDRTPKRLRDALSELGVHPYWTRAWILQEIYLAKSVRILCGTSETDPGALRRCYKGKSQAFMDDLDDSDQYLLLILYTGFYWVLKRVYTYEVPTRITNLEGIYRVFRGAGWRSRDQLFWEVFLDRGQNSKCFDCRDHIYSLLAMTGHDSLSPRPFNVDYGESTIDTFRRSADHFAAWHQPAKVFALWKALDHSFDCPRTVIERFNNKMLIVIRMMSNSARKEKPGVRCGSLGGSIYNDMFDPAWIEGYSDGDVLLCPSVWEPSDKCVDNVHALVRPIGPPGSEAFAISLQVRKHRWYPRVDDVEVWRTDDGTETKMTSWTEFSNAAEECFAINCKDSQTWQTKPHFLLKTTLRYLEQLMEVAPGWEDTDVTDESRNLPLKFTTVSQN